MTWLTGLLIISLSDHLGHQVKFLQLKITLSWLAMYLFVCMYVCMHLYICAIKLPLHLSLNQEIVTDLMEICLATYVIPGQETAYTQKRVLFVCLFFEEGIFRIGSTFSTYHYHYSLLCPVLFPFMTNPNTFSLYNFGRDCIHFAKKTHTHTYSFSLCVDQFVENRPDWHVCKCVYVCFMYMNLCKHACANILFLVWQ